METPADIVIRLFGGEMAVAAICNIHLSGVYRWRYPKERGGTCGNVPARHHPALLLAARKERVPLEPAHLIMTLPDELPENPEITEGANAAIDHTRCAYAAIAGLFL